MPRSPWVRDPLTDAFYGRSTVAVARALLGKLLVHATPEGVTAGRIVETEAYLRNDPACHASRGMTPRNAPMFGPAGHAYIYFIYGMYHCFNVVTGPRGVGEAVLIRALEPVAGIPLMEKRRGTGEIRKLCSGPGKLVLAMGIDKSLNSADLRRGALRILSPAPRAARGRIAVTTRVGINVAADAPLRFYLEGNPFISRK